MGCCQSARINAQQEKMLTEGIKTAIECDSTKKLSILLAVLNNKARKNDPLMVDKAFLHVDKYKFNALGYCVYLGSAKVFKQLFESGASLKTMEEMFFSQNLRAINIVCEKGFLDLLKFYLPLYMRHYRSSVASFRTSTLDLTGENLNKEFAIHLACRAGMFHIVSYLYNYFKKYSETPAEFDLETKDESSEDDVSLIACRSGSFPLVKLLYEQCGVRFDWVNKSNENAIMACVMSEKQSPNFSYLEILTYLVEVVKVDVKHRHEEVLLMTENPQIISFLEDHLEKIGIYVKKELIDIENIQKSSKDTRIIRDSLDSNGLLQIFDCDSIASSIHNDLATETPSSLTNIFKPY